MRKTRPWLYVFLPVLYVGLVFALVVFQFSKKSDSFSQSLGDLTVSGKTSEGGAPVDLALHGRGLEFQFNAARTLLLVGTDNNTRKLQPTQWAWKDGNLVVQFQSGVVLTFQKTGPGGNLLLLQPTLPAALTNSTARLRLPFAGESGGKLAVDPDHPFVVITRGNQRFLASLDGQGDQIEAEGTFVLEAHAGKVRPVRLEALPEGANPDHVWLVQNLGADAIADARDALAAYADKAWKTWGEGRLKLDQGGWLTADGTVRFSSRLVAAWAHEALVRGGYASVMARVQSVLAAAPSTWTFDALPYLGNLMEVTQAQRRAVDAAAARTAVDWTGQPRLWLDALYYGSEGAAARLQKLLLTGDLPTRSAELLSVLANLARMKGAGAQEATLEGRAQEVVDELVSRVSRQEGDLYLLTPEGYLDLKSSLLLGRLLLDQTSNLQSEQWQAIGSQLLLSALQHQDALGRIPEIVVLAPGQADRQEGGFYPEDVYESVVSPWAVETPLGAGYAANAFVRTALPLVAKASSAQQLKLTFQFPVGSAESIVIASLPPFDSISLHGIRWRTDPQFQSYTDGWYYSASTQTLYVKIKHREEAEQLVVNFQPPE